MGVTLSQMGRPAHRVFDGHSSWRSISARTTETSAGNADEGAEMALQDIDEKGGKRQVLALDHLREFNQTWDLIPAADQAAIEVEINRRLDSLLSSPNPR